MEPDVPIPIDRKISSAARGEVSFTIHRGASFPVAREISLAVCAEVPFTTHRDVALDTTPGHYSGAPLSETCIRAIVVTNGRVCVSPRSLGVSALPDRRSQNTSV